MRFGVLGPLEVTDDCGDPVDIGGPQSRLVLAALVAAGDRAVPPDALIDVIWPDRPPPSAAGTLQSYVSRLRRALPDVPLVLHPAGYRLDLADHTVDLQRFEALAASGHAELEAGRPVAARRTLAEALSLWRGSPLPELVDVGAAMAEVAALEEVRLAALEARIDADLALGRHVQVIAELQKLATEHPLREGLHRRLALALYRSGRQAEALRAVADAGRTLRDELGLEPGPELRRLEQAILGHDPALDAPPSATVRADDVAGSPFVGRGRELDELLAAYAAASTDAQFVVLEGEPGIGKTRLAAELAAAVSGRGALAVWAPANELGATQAMWPWLEALRVLLPHVEDTSDALAGLLAGDAAPVPGPAGASQFERFEAIAALLERAGEDAPVVVLLDDLQWCDVASLDLLRFLVARLRRGVLVVVTVRTLEVGRSDAVTEVLAAIARRPSSRRLRISGLSLAATGELLEALSAGPLVADLPARIHDRAEGNPFYTLELARLLEDPAGVAGEVPATVRDAIRRHLGLLPPSTVDLLTLAAVIDRELDLPTVAAVAGIELAECVDRLDPAAQHRLLVADPQATTSVRFSHALVREVLVDGLTPLRRAQVHLRVADVMDSAGVGNDEIERYADHLWRAASLGVGGRAADALERAAEVAVRRVAYASAEELLRRAADLRQGGGPSTPARQARLDVQLRLLEVVQATRYFSGTDGELLRSTQELAGGLGRDDVSRELSWAEWAAASRRASVAEAVAMADGYVRRWGADPSPQVRASTEIVQGVTAWSRGRNGDAIAHLDRAVTMLQDAPPPARPLEREQPLVAESFRLYCLAARGDLTPEQALARFDELLAALPPTAVDGRHQLLYALACRLAAVHARWEALEGLVRAALERDPAAQFAFFGGQLLLYRALVETRHGELDAALASFVDGRARYRAVGGGTGLATCQAMLAEQVAIAGRVGEAAELATSARRQIVETGEEANEVPVRIAEGVVAFASGDRARAAEQLTAAVAAGHRQKADTLAARAHAVAATLGIDLTASA